MLIDMAPTASGYTKQRAVGATNRSLQDEAPSIFGMFADPAQVMYDDGLSGVSQSQCCQSANPLPPADPASSILGTPAMLHSVLLARVFENAYRFYGACLYK